MRYATYTVDMIRELSSFILINRMADIRVGTFDCDLACSCRQHRCSILLLEFGDELHTSTPFEKESSIISIVKMTI